MQVTTYKCDYCGMIVEDYLDHFGWIHFNNFGFEIVGDQNRNPRVCRRGSWLMSDSAGLDFCSISCFLKYLFLSDKTTNYKNDPEGTKTFWCEILKQLFDLFLQEKDNLFQSEHAEKIFSDLLALRKYDFTNQSDFRADKEG